VGNGDPSCHEPDVLVPQWPVRSIDIRDWRWLSVTNPYQPNLPEIAEQFDDSGWSRHNVRSSSGPLKEREHGVFRARFQVKEQDLEAATIELSCGMIDDDGWVYVNGQKVGESHDSQAAPAFDVKQVLHPGENTLAVIVANYSGAGGVNKGVALQLQDKPRLPEWRRSLFNGLAQIIVQSTRNSGTINLTGQSYALKPATVAVQAQACILRPAIP